MCAVRVALSRPGFAGSGPGAGEVVSEESGHRPGQGGAEGACEGHQRGPGA